MLLIYTFIYIYEFKEPLYNSLEPNSLFWLFGFYEVTTCITETCSSNLLMCSLLSLSVMQLWLSRASLSKAWHLQLITCNIYLHSRQHHTSQTRTHCWVHGTLETSDGLGAVVRLHSARYDVLQWNNSWCRLPCWFMSCMLAAPLLTNFCLSASARH